MNQDIVNKYKEYMDNAISNYYLKDYNQSFRNLEFAHILGQRSILYHTKTHWWMLKIGLKKNDKKEVFGQIFRIIASIVFSRIWVPEGNTGGVDVNPFKKMEIPEEIRYLYKT